MEQKTQYLVDLGLRVTQGRDRPITGLAIASNAVRPGFLFAALPGTAQHGARYVGQALDAGAIAILTDRAGEAIAQEHIGDRDISLIITSDAREAIARTAALWYGVQPRIIAAVTGTNGKTSVASFTRQIWERLHHRAINIGTTGVEGAFAAPARHTTPDALTLQAILAEANAQNVDHVVMEASSHGLDQRRLEGVSLSAAAFTNLTQDHLDYHQTMTAYGDAKARLFTTLLPEEATAVINTHGAYGTEMAARARNAGRNVMTVGYDANCDLRLLRQRHDSTGQQLRLSWDGQVFLTRLNLIGAFQAENVAVAAGLVLASGQDDPAEVFAALDHLRGVRGRMQLAATRKNGAAVYVDYAHTPDAIATALQALRPHVMGRIVLVMGAGGDRDRAKRPLMGAAAHAHADLTIITDDNPRSEDPATIRAAIRAACPDAREIADRAEAILHGVHALQPGDALLIAGKGHETGQTIAGQVYPFDDVEQASLAVAALDGVI